MPSPQTKRTTTTPETRIDFVRSSRVTLPTRSRGYRLEHKV
ncbi:hypothetical protein M7I_8026 [Glarea lozoyensis 74030]|uniref:Uncharacterized protein n=1 Tax=Glarea lozoyensis (strain ATCC 74030 / MF5533) TaxID=1104152 RepID=H0EYW5_GLAL7|nr:hypothetical protein M7I_8026 [Glarea lozoyensis 74030]